MRIVFNKPVNNPPLYCESIGYNWKERSVNRPTGYATYHWLQTESGSGTVVINNQSMVLQPNQGILLKDHLPHQYHPNPGDSWTTSFLTFDGPLMDIMTNLFEVKNYVIIKQLAPALTTFISKYFDTFVGKDLVSLNEQSINLYRFLTLVHDNELYAHQANLHNQKIGTQIIQFINRHYSEPITNKSISNATRYSVAYQNRVFTKIYNQTPLEYLDNYRMQKAKEFLLTQANWDVNKVAEETGFGSSSQFIFHFRKYFGVTPNQFRHNS
ncbi:AraC family transcriptional regulator [Lentilactobacillus kosonis]|uniref:Transcriptional regulator, AraC family n=1 Tax=Lentilactobacillus kosonis TaxID=2810561 RepID=A0A401FIL7_9LACO|nr:AraC family transcriptional regulator [Lentilactobacillus kosonis]GAY72199.1 transcriptional regulator, AraC family [Lentilactobacillus kosonis]